MKFSTLVLSLVPAFGLSLGGCAMPEGQAAKSASGSTQAKASPKPSMDDTKVTNSENDSEATKDAPTQTGTEAVTATNTNESTGTETASETGTDPTNTTVVPLGTVSAETTTLAGFKGKSVYAFTSNNDLIITVSNVAVDEAMFKAVDHFTCTPCEGSDDAHCSATAAASISGIFIGKTANSPAGYGVSAAGFPLNMTNTLLQLPTSYTNPAYVTDITANLKVGLTISASSDQQTGAVSSYGTLNFTGALPTATGSAFTATPKFTFPDGKTYTATWAGKVYAMPTQPTPPKCQANQYLAPTYK